MTTPYGPNQGRPPLPPGAPVPPPSGAHIPPPGGAPQLSKQQASGEPVGTPKNERPFSTKQIAAGLVALLALIFVAENTRKATVRLLIPQVSVPLFLVIIISLALGALVTFLLMWRKHRDEERRRVARRPRR